MGSNTKQHNLSLERLNQILMRCRELRIGVVGDLALDAYWYADMTKSLLSRETPLFPRPIVSEIYAPGAGANVAANVKALGLAQVSVFSVIGDDWCGDLLKKELVLRDIDVQPLVVSEQRRTSTYIKPILMGYDSQQEDARLDFENAEPLTPASEQALIQQITAALPALDAMVIADQMTIHGVVNDTVREAFNHLAYANPDTLWAVDSRQNIRLFRNMVLKPNRVETTAALYPNESIQKIGHEELAQGGMALSRDSGRPVFITLSEAGVLACTEDEHHILTAVPAQPPLDPVGAGDTFMAAMIAALAAGATAWEAGAMANLAAAVTVKKLNQTGVATPDEILALAEEILY